MPNKIGVAQIVAIIISIIAIVISLVALNNETFKSGYKKGFNACIEENNLYERYEKQYEKNKFEITDKDLEMLIKMENLIGYNKKKIFNKNGEYKFEEREYSEHMEYSWLEKKKITEDDFMEFWSFVDRVMLARKDGRAQNFSLKGKNKKKFIKGTLKEEN